jgi:parallel beta-helix repeat protein
MTNSQNTITENLMDANGYSICLSGATAFSNTISANVCHLDRIVAIKLDSGSFNNVIRGNDASNTLNAGTDIWLNGSNNNAVIGNICSYYNQNGNPQPNCGFLLTASCYNILNGNQVNNNNLGFYFDGDSNYNIVTNNHASGNTGYNYFDSGSNNQIHSCFNGTTWVT